MSELQASTQKQLRAFIERIERLEEEKAALASDIKDVFAEAKAIGFDVKVMRQVIRLRKQEAHVRKENELLLATYLHALGMDAEAFGIDSDGSEDGFSVAAE
ncbi:MAG: DUF2312 domain-containing protein [Rhizobiales bacterium]|nr:DUF2312 domain-containing protein [Hyphomicrobiales bacterium]